MRPMEDTIMILHFKNDPKRINALEEMEITDHILSIIQDINPHYQMLQSVQGQATIGANNC
jgi:hypothetical protein